MPRQARVIVPGMPHHIMQRGHNRSAVFVEPKDSQYYLDNLAEWKFEIGLKVFSCCLVTNHVHLAVEAGDDRRRKNRSVPCIRSVPFISQWGMPVLLALFVLIF